MLLYANATYNKMCNEGQDGGSKVTSFSMRQIIVGKVYVSGILYFSSELAHYLEKREDYKEMEMLACQPLLFMAMGPKEKMNKS